MFRNHPLKFTLRIALVIGCIVGLCTLTPKIIGTILLWTGIGLGLLMLLWWWVSVLGKTLIITDQRVTKRTGIFSKKTNELYHTDIRNIQVEQRFWQRVFGVGKIFISYDGQGSIETVMRGLPKPSKIKIIIDNHRRTDAPRGE